MKMFVTIEPHGIFFLSNFTFAHIQTLSSHRYSIADTDFSSILKPSSNRSPNIFTLVQKVEIGHTKRFNSKDKSKLCRDFAVYFISK